MIFKATRLEVIDHTSTREGFARQFVKWENLPFIITIEVQDNGQTIKIFLDDLEKVERIANNRLMIPTAPLQTA